MIYDIGKKYGISPEDPSGLYNIQRDYKHILKHILKKKLPGLKWRKVEQPD